MSDPLQELAEKLIEEFRERGGRHIEGMLTASVGTLLQAERAATIKLAAEAQCEYCESQIPGKPGYGQWAPVEGNMHKSTRSAKWDSYCAARHMLPLATPEAASALSAVVQRETEKLRELLKWFTSEWSGICPCGILSLDADKPEFKHKKDCPYAVAKLALQ